MGDKLWLEEERVTCIYRGATETREHTKVGDDDMLALLCGEAWRHDEGRKVEGGEVKPKLCGWPLTRHTHSWLSLTFEIGTTWEP